MRFILIISLLFLIMVVPTMATWLSPEAPPPIVYNNNTNITVNAIHANQFCDGSGFCLSNLTNFTSNINLSSVNLTAGSNITISSNVISWVADWTINFINGLLGNYYNKTKINNTYVPYQGATQNVNLSVNNITATKYVLYGNTSVGMYYNISNDLLIIGDISRVI